MLETTAKQRRVVVRNKADLSLHLMHPMHPMHLDLSAMTGEGVEQLIAAIAATLNASEPLRDQPADHQHASRPPLERARTSIDRAATALEGEVPEEFPLLDLQEAAHALQEITGQRTSDDLLHHIFERFCIGK